MNVKQRFFTLTLLIFFKGLFSQTDSTRTQRIKFISGSVEARLDMPLSINPDFYCMRMSRWGSKWNNLVGSTVGLVNYDNKKVRVSLSLSGFVSVHDYSKYQFMSWQLWRGNLGSSIFFNSSNFDKLLGKNGKVVAELGWYHESQHATDVIGYVYTFLEPPFSDPHWFNNADIRSFQYFVAGVCYDWQIPGKNWRLFLNPRYRHFPKSLLRNERILINAFSTEAGIHYKLNKSFTTYVQGFFEKINNAFVAKEKHYKSNWNKDPFIYQNLEVGLTYQTEEKKQFNLFLNYSNSNGRGLDFIIQYREFGAGFRIVL
jgi:hypothetical protein